MVNSIESLESRTLMSVSSAEKADIRKLASDLSAIHEKSDVTDTQRQALSNDLKQVAAVATRPSAATTSRLRTDFQRVIGDGIVTSAERALLAKDVRAVVASAGIPSALAQQTAADFATIVTYSHVTKADAKLIFSDVAAIYTDL